MAISYSVFVDWDYTGTGAADFSQPNDDITNYVLAYSSQIGIQQDAQQVANVGEATISVKNVDRRFSIGYAAGPLFGKLIAHKPVKVTVTNGTTTWTDFYGWTRDFSADPGGVLGAGISERKATITCVDNMARFQNVKPRVPLQENKRTDDLLRIIINEAFAASAASGGFTLTGNPSNGDWVDIGGARYTFKTALGGTANDVLIGANKEATVDNLAAAVNGAEGNGTLYSTPTLPNPNVTAAGARTYRREVLADNPIRYYRLDESAGTTAADSGQNGVGGKGTYTGGYTLSTASGLGDGNTAVTLNGTTGYVALSSMELANRSFTIEGFVKLTALPSVGNNANFFFAYNAYTFHNAMNLTIQPSGGLAWDYSGDAILSAGGLITTATWYHIAATFNYAGDLSTLYINGAQVASGAAGPFTGVSPVLTIGSQRGLLDFLNGVVDEPAIYFSALSATRISTHYSARSVAEGIVLTARLRGTVGNAIMLAKSGANITASGATLTGGVDYPVSPAPSLEVGRVTIAVAGDQWDQSTECITAAQEITNTEHGYLFAARNGAITFKNVDYEFRRVSASNVVSFNSENQGVEGISTEEEIYNSVEVSYAPRVYRASGIVAKMNQVAVIPGQSGEERWSGIVKLAGGGSKTIRLDFSDPTTGQKCGARNIKLPLVAGTHWTANEQSDGSGVSYTYYTPSPLTFSTVVTSTGVEITVKNTALGPLYLLTLQVEGELVVQYESVSLLEEDATSQQKYNPRRLPASLPLATSEVRARALARYLLRRYKDPVYRVKQIRVKGVTVVGGAELYAVELGDVIAYSDLQTQESGRYMVTGRATRMGKIGERELTLYVRKLDAAQYWILGNATYGKIGTAAIGI